MSYSESEIANMLKGRREGEVIDLKNSEITSYNKIDAIQRKIKLDNAYMKKYIFLDIDGVLNSEKYTEECYYKSGREYPYFGNGVPFDPSALTQLMYLCRYIKSKGDVPYIVLSSSWRLNKINLAIAEARLEEYNIQIDDVLDEDFFGTEARGALIQRYLNEIGHSVDFVIIDDESFDIKERFFLNNLVLTDPTIGFDSIAKETAKNILYREENIYDYKNTK